MKFKVPKIKALGKEFDVKGKAIENYKEMEKKGKETSKKFQDLL